MAEPDISYSQHKLFSSIEEADAALPLGKPQKLRVDGLTDALCIVRTRTGIFAVADSCPHLGESLSKGTINYLNEVVCPWHSYRFSLTTGEECENRTRLLKRFTITQQPDGIYLMV